MSRERELVDTFVELSRTLVGEYEIDEFLHMLTERCASLVKAEAVGVMLADEGGSLQVASASTEDMQALELIEMQQQQGPCWDAFHTGDQVIETNLEEARERWPAFIPRAVELGLRSVHAFPMQLRGDTIGALNVFYAESGRLDEIDVETLQALADVATVAIVNARAGHDASELTSQLQRALDSRVVIEQAKGVLAQHDGTTLEEAFVRLRKHSRDHNRRLREVAQHVVEERTLPDA